MEAKRREKRSWSGLGIFSGEMVYVGEIPI
jgi:hypothetical protein